VAERQLRVVAIHRLTRKSTKPQAVSRPDSAEAAETRAAVAVTVAWMLTCTSTAVAMVVIAALGLLSLIVPFAGQQKHPLLVVAGMLLMVALATGALCLGLTPLAYRVRRAAPPRAIAIAAVLIGLTPLVTLIVLALFSR
jgi:hypothetical protein